MGRESRRIRREKKTISVMIEMFCRARHDHGARNGVLCDHCAKLHDYAMQRIDKCPFCLAKPTCVNCPIHCYKPDMRERVRTVMRYSGPRMLKRHPLLALLHKLDGLRRVEPPARAKRAAAR